MPKYYLRTSRPLLGMSECRPPGLHFLAISYVGASLDEFHKREIAPTMRNEAQRDS